MKFKITCQGCGEETSIKKMWTKPRHVMRIFWGCEGIYLSCSCGKKIHLESQKIEIEEKQ